MADYRLQAQYFKSQVVRDRNQGGLTAWSGYTATAPIPPDKPSEDWVRLRIMAEQIPLNIASYVDRTLAYYLQDGATVDNLRLYLSEWNTEEVETTLSTQVQQVTDGYMPRFCAQEIPDDRVAQWYADHGFPATLSSR